MPLERQEIADKFIAEGIPENLAVAVSVESNEDLTSWISNYKAAIPAKEKALAEYTKEELEEIAKDPQFKGAKGFQGIMDAMRAKYQKIEPTPPAPPAPDKTNSEIEALKAQMAALVESNTKKDAEAELAKAKSGAVATIKAAGIEGFYASSLVAMLGADFSEANVKAKIDAYEAQRKADGIVTPSKGGKPTASKEDLKKIMKDFKPR